MFSLPDPRRALQRVSLVHELTRPRRVPFARHGAQFELNYMRGVPPVMNEVLSTDLMRTAAQRALGAAAVRDAEQSTGAEDFAVFLDKVPGSLARLGVWDGVQPKVDLHSSQFVADERAIAAGVRLMTHTALAALHH